jgi:hypothetical protein
MELTPFFVSVLWQMATIDDRRGHMRRTLASVRPEAPSILMPASEVAGVAQRRLVVVVGNVDDTAYMARRIHAIASGNGASVLMVGVTAGASTEAEVRRQIAMTAAFVRDAGSRVEVRIEEGWEWLKGIRFLLSEHDTVACGGTAGSLAGRWSLPDRLSSQLHRPILVIDEPGEAEAHQPGLARRVSPWLGSLAVILGFLCLQIRLNQGGAGFPTLALLVLSVPIEICLIWLCNAALG